MTACPKLRPIRDKAYTRRAQRMPCDVPGCFAHGTEGNVILAHINIAGNFGRSLKAGDDTSFYLCQQHHDEFDSRILTSDRDRALWIVRNIVIPTQKQRYLAWKMGVGR